MDDIAEAIPADGRKIALDDGFVIIRRNPSNFQSYYDDPNDSDIIGGRTSYLVRFYSM